ncbi:MAG: hypothetical protein M3Y33_08575 [Actinomycetota bacterium]|nr:hypothetical protein [Actinomycetota bacterium]
MPWQPAGQPRRLHPRRARPRPAAGPTYHNPLVLQKSIRDTLDKRLADPSGAYYEPGVHITGVQCIEQSAVAATCLITRSSGQSETDAVVISADGLQYITK